MAENNEERLKRLTLMARERYVFNEPFTVEEVNAYLDCVRTIFGSEEASGLLNLVLAKMKEKGYNANDLGMALVDTIAERKKQ